jgi:hypothetical protein
MRCIRQPGSHETLLLRLCGSVAVITLLAVGGCGGEDEPSFGGIEERQAKEAEELKKNAHADTTPQQ